MVTSSEERGELEHYRVAMLQRRVSALLVENHNGTLRLPSVAVPQHTRLGEQISKAIRQRWNVGAVVIDVLPPATETNRCAMVEVLALNKQSPINSLVSLSAADFNVLHLSSSERDVLNGLLDGDAVGDSPFSRLGWVEEAREWIQASVPNRRIEFTDDIRTANVGGAFALVRFGTSEPPAFWLKATGVPNRHEFAVTLRLAELLPTCLPPLVAARSDWNAWITEEIGQPLETIMNLSAFEQAAHCLAKLQIGCLTQVDKLVECGCFDQRLPILREGLPRMIRYFEDAMAAQTSTRVAPLEPVRLQELSGFLEKAFDCMQVLGVPDTLIHNDINAGNILYDGRRAFLIDWAEAHIGNPFITFQHILVQASSADTTGKWVPRLKGIYRDHWRSVLDGVRIDCALALCPPLAITSLLMGRDPHFASPNREDPHCQSYARSLARHIDRAVRAPEFLEAICL